MGAPMRLLNLSGWSIKRMLRLEEALLRHEGGNWCLVNALPAGSKTHPTAPTVVVGLSGKPELLLDEAKLRGAGVGVVGGSRAAAVVGGNAQCISKDKWIHHTSFLWDYDPEHMAFLALPAKRPEYRGDRDHGAFLSRLRDHAATASKPEGMIEALKAEARRDAGGWKPVDFPPP
ncbi:lipoate-protein ligase [Aureococcus anophagefferens]|nr:lipoate-protein ligase [Aureococcus anophagefferens]